jgi:hypothetical protein
MDIGALAFAMLLSSGAPAGPAAAVTGESLVWHVREMSSDGGSRNVWGGRLVGSVVFGRLRVAARADFAALPDHEPPATIDPTAYESAEVVGAVGLALARSPQASLEVVGIGGHAFNLRDGGPSMPIIGGGLSVHLLGGWVYAAVVRHEAVSRDARLGIGAQVRMPAGFIIVGDGVAGPGGFLRLGVATKVP